MARSDGETVEVGMALFGAAADFPVPPCAAEAEEPEAADGNSAKRPRPSTSPVWADYEKLFKTVNRKTVRAFEEYIKIAHNPKYAKVSRQTSSRDILKYFTDCKAKLVESFSTSVNCVYLTSDIWSGNDKEDYISVVAHYINSDWQLEKRVLGLVLIDVSHNGQNIADRAASVLADYGLTEKVLAATLDNASSNASAMQKLKPVLSKYLGFDVIEEPEYASSSQNIASSSAVNSMFLHQRCAYHILDLIVKEALITLKPFIESFRTAISFLNSSNQRIAAYRSYCIATGVRPRKFQLDMEIALHLKNYANDVHIRSVVQPMIDKYNKYWRDIPLLYSFAFILDPRAKMKGFTRVLRRLGGLTSTDYSTYLVGTRARLADVYNKYDEKYGAVRLRRTDPPVLSGKSRSAWDEIYDDDGGAVLGGGIFPGNPNMSRDTSATSLLHAVRSSASNASELVSYLDCDTVNHLTDDFNIFDWWHQHKLTYPVLSIMAKDILTVPVSTVSSESTFSMTGKIIEERRRNLKPEWWRC
ncbi:uncharacterized protein LOC120653078 [Panicum virgatum]|uniref:uncharacterized protein LOC120653078 n=1 Tax=Panicum virgatum TaxID=38727 RepID=UPI0019D58B67|nr:uncharacterized protein LOC120653078 [Panicum virgatum]